MSNKDLSLSQQINVIVKAANFQLYCLSCIRKYLTLAAQCIVVHSPISYHIDYCNSPLAGLSKSHCIILYNIILSLRCYV